MGRHKMDVELMKFRAKRYHYLSTLFRDEMPLELISAMQKDEFLEGLNESVKGCGFIDLISGAEVMTSYLKRDNAERLHKELGYDYADLFLNAGPNPVFPYESVQVSKEHKTTHWAVAILPGSRPFLSQLVRYTPGYSLPGRLVPVSL